MNDELFIKYEAEFMRSQIVCLEIIKSALLDMGKEEITKHLVVVIDALHDGRIMKKLELDG